MNELTLIHTPRFARALAVAIAALAIFALAATGARAANYVGLGDSYAAGPLIPNPVLPLGCLKSSNNYAHVAAPSIGLAATTPARAPRPAGPNRSCRARSRPRSIRTNRAWRAAPPCSSRR